MKRATRQLTSSLQSGDLKGKAYGSAKNYVLNVLNPLMNKASEGISDGLADLATYKYEDSQIAHYGNIDVAQLQAEKQTKEEARRRVVSQRESLQTSPLSILATLSPVAYSGAIFAMNTFEHQMTDSIKDIDEKLLAFESFESNTNALFQDTNAVFEALQRAVNALNSIKISGSGAGLSLSMPSGMGGLVSKMTNSKLGAGDKDSSYVSLPSKYQDEIEKIKNSNLSATQKADKIAAIYENYLYSLAPSAFDKYDEMRSKFSEAKSVGRIKAEEELNKELQKLPIDIRQIARFLGDDVISISSQSGFDYVQFYNMVQTKQPLDLKNREFGQGHYSIWSRGWNGNETPDFLGNYLYGYYGQGVFIVGGESLKIAGGVAQIWSDKNSKPWKIIGYHVGFNISLKGGLLIWKMTNYGDNPDDGRYIQEGIDDYEKYH
ncbi:polymorphic toxin type 44 domain-containing protein [Lactococcus muris]|uniref:polymorphic toxin type 44 domain-containing protein n=1 Tax=Lactococcus muris TaxID=2941330 RepID=UPI00204123DA